MPGVISRLRSTEFDDWLSPGESIPHGTQEDGCRSVENTRDVTYRCPGVFHAEPRGRQGPSGDGCRTVENSTDLNYLCPGVFHRSTPVPLVVPFAARAA